MAGVQQDSEPIVADRAVSRDLFARPDRPRKALLAIVALALTWRILLSMVGTISSNVLDDVRPDASREVHQQLEAARLDVSDWRPVHLWFNWDALHYENLSRTWFEIERPVAPNVITATGGRAWNEFSWPPLYPVGVGVLHWLTRIEAGLLMVLGGLALFVGFLALVRRIAIADGDDAPTVNATVLLNAAAPFAFFLGTPLSEPLFVVLAAVVLLATRRNNWLLASVAAALMVWTRMNGVFMVVPLAVAGVLAIRAADERTPRRYLEAFAPPTICLAAFGAYLGFARWLSGTARAPFLTQKYGWGNTAGNPITNLLGNLDRWQYITVALYLIAVVWLLARRWLPPVDATYCFVMLLAATTVARTFGAAPRYVAVAFPVVSAIARWSTARKANNLVLPISAALQAAFFVMWANYWLTIMY